MASKYNRVPSDYPPLQENWKYASTEALQEMKKQLDITLHKQPPDGTPVAAHVLDSKRIGDEERNRAIEILNSGHLTGHLTLAELDARQDWVLAATTADQLNKIVKDLPTPKPAEVVQPQSRELPMWFKVTVGVCAGLACLVAMITVVAIMIAIL